MIFNAFQQVGACADDEKLGESTVEALRCLLIPRGGMGPRLFLVTIVSTERTTALRRRVGPLLPSRYRRHGYEKRSAMHAPAC